MEVENTGVQLAISQKLANVEEKDNEYEPLSKENGLINLNLSDVTERMDDKFVYNKRLLYKLVPICIICLIIGNINAWISPTGNVNINNVPVYLCNMTVAFCAILLLICIIILIYCAKIVKNESFLNSLNNLFNIANINTSTDLCVNVCGMQYFVLLAMMIMIYYCVVLMIHALYRFPTLKCSDDPHDFVCEYVKPSEPSAWIAFIILGSLILCQSVSPQCIKQIEEEKSKIIKSYACVEEIDERIQKKLKELRKSADFGQRKIELLVVFVVWFIYVSANKSTTIYDSGDDNVSRIIVSILSYIVDSIIATFGVALLLHSVPIYHYKFAGIIMKELLIPIHTGNIHDIIGWWQIRAFYLDCIVNIYTFRLKWIITFLLLTSFTFIVIFFFNRTFDLLIVMVYLMSDALIVVSNAVSFSKNQLNHTKFINRERLLFNVNEYVEYNENHIARKIMHESRDYILDVINKDIIENMDGITVFGINMDTHFILFLRAIAIAVGTAGVALITDNK